MKSSRIVIFIFCVLAGLSLLCVIFPAEGLQIGDFRLEFPSLAYALDAEPKEDFLPIDTLEEEPEDTIPEIDEALLAQMNEKEAEFARDWSKNPTRIYLPNDSTEYLDAFFDALAEADKHRVHIMHYGDSQLEGDRMTCILRQEFQEAFGGRGIGLVPMMQTVSGVTYQLEYSGDATRYLAYASKADQAEHHRYGPLCQMAEVDGEASFTFRCVGGRNFSHSGSFSSVTVMAKGSGSLELLVGTDSVGDLRSIESESLQMVRFDHGGYYGTLNVSGQMELYGFILDGGTGVQMDNIGLRGSSGTIFTSIDRSTLTPFFARDKVSLIILQYGGNSVPYLKGQENINGYISSLRKQIRLFQSLAPESCILFVGPSDMATIDGEEMVTYPCIPPLVAAMRKMCSEEGIAFWNMYGAMGGSGTMVQWVEKGLASEDYVHFSNAGARKVSKMLFHALESYYTYYRVRVGLDGIEEPDTMQQDTVIKEVKP